MHRPFTGHVRQRRPNSSRPTSLQASPRERAVDLRKGGRLRIPGSFIDDTNRPKQLKQGRESCDRRCASHHLKRVTRAMPMRPSRLDDGARAGLSVDPGQSASSSLRILDQQLTGKTARSTREAPGSGTLSAGIAAATPRESLLLICCRCSKQSQICSS